MDEINLHLSRWQELLCEKISLAEVFARNPTAYKWKALHRSIRLREAVFWRVHDLLTQAHLLFEGGHILGARILIRSAIESIATLICLNALTKKVLAGTLNFHKFSYETSTLLLGSRDKSTKHNAVNILSILKQCEKKYPGITDIYSTLSESAHPNFEGICFGYSRVDYETDETNFSNCWGSMWGDRHHALMQLCIKLFESEYNQEWTSQFKRLEIWVTENDPLLEATKDARV